MLEVCKHISHWLNEFSDVLYFISMISWIRVQNILDLDVYSCQSAWSSSVDSLCQVSLDTQAVRKHV